MWLPFEICTRKIVPPPPELIFVTNITNYIRGEKVVMWRNFGTFWGTLYICGEKITNMRSAPPMFNGHWHWKRTLSVRQLSDHHQERCCYSSRGRLFLNSLWNEIDCIASKLRFLKALCTSLKLVKHVKTCWDTLMYMYKVFLHLFVTKLMVHFFVFDFAKNH